MIKDPLVTDTLNSLVKISVGDGTRVLFWKDQWIHGRAAVIDIAPLILSLVSTRTRNCRSVEDAMLDNRWMMDLSEPVSAPAAQQCIQLWFAISNTDRDFTRSDQFIWPWTPDMQNSARPASRR